MSVCILNFGHGNAQTWMEALQSGFRRARKNLRVEIIGPAFLLPDTALVLFDIIRSRPPQIRLHTHTWSCLGDGGGLIWLAGDTRSMRSDTWIQIPNLKNLVMSGGFCRAVPTEEESPSETDTRTVLAHMGQWIPVAEVAGMRLFEGDLREFGLLDDEASTLRLAEYFSLGDARA